MNLQESPSDKETATQQEENEIVNDDEKAFLVTDKQKIGKLQEEGPNDKIHESIATTLQEIVFYKHFTKEYRPMLIYFTYAVVFTANTLINVDHGSIPGCAVVIKKDFHMNDFEYGIMGSIVYGGITVGSALACVLFQQREYIRQLLAGSLALCMLTLWVFSLSNNYYANVTLRFLIGIFQIFVSIFYPIWSDTFSQDSYRTKWLTIFILSSPLGTVIGFILTSEMVTHADWRYSFLIQGALMIPIFTSIMLTPLKYYDIEGTLRFKKRCLINLRTQLESSLEETDKEIDEQLQQQLKYYKLENIRENRQAVIQKSIERTDFIIQSQFSNIQVFKQDDESLYHKLSNLMADGVFVCLSLALTGLYFLVTGIQYWAPYYMQTVLGMAREQATWYFSAMTFSGPISGVVVGGIVTQMFGGYAVRQAWILQCFVGVCAVLCALPLPIVTDYKAFVKLTWFLLFFGGFILPPVTGVMVNSVAETKRPQANSVAQLSYSLLGYLPGPIVYGFVASISGINGQRYALGALVYSTIISIGLLNYGIYLRILRDKQEPQRLSK